MPSTHPGAREALLSTLTYEPRELAFGTSGRRGRVVDLTQMEVYINALAELEYLQSIPPGDGGIVRGEEFYFAYDLRPSSTGLVAEENGRGEIAQAIEAAISDAGMRAVNCGQIPTPALAFYALSRGKGSMMVTGSHIPFDRNGYKTNTSRGELLKAHEGPIGDFVRRVRERVYGQSPEESKFDAQGMFKQGHRELPPVDEGARLAYKQRYLDFFEGSSLAGMRILCYQHSAVGRDLLAEILHELGAEVIPAGRSDAFIPIDTENIDAERLAVIQALADEARAVHGHLDAIVSTDGDSDRPLLLGMDCDGKTVRFFGGDCLGMVVADFLGADAVVVPISCNDGIDRSALAEKLAPKTRIGSPYVIAGMEQALEQGKRRVCGWEANGGFLTGSEIVRNGRRLAALPTRDALLPILCALFSAREKGTGVCDLFDALPRRYSRAGLLKQFPRARALKILSSFRCSDEPVREVIFDGAKVLAHNAECEALDCAAAVADQLKELRERFESFFSAVPGIGSVVRLNYVDGVRATFSSGDVVHLRPSGNADELRIYAVAGTMARAEEIVARGLAEPDGILRQMERAIAS